LAAEEQEQKTMLFYVSLDNPRNVMFIWRRALMPVLLTPCQTRIMRVRARTLLMADRVDQNREGLAETWSSHEDAAGLCTRSSPKKPYVLYD
jgi:hypothetical protein